MKYRFIYKNKKNGKKVYSEVKLFDDDLELVREFKDGKMRNFEILQK